MKIKRSLILALCLIFTLCLVLTACNPIIIPGPLQVPVVTIADDGMASWKAVEHANGYICKIDGVVQEPTELRSVQLNKGQTIEVKAFGNRKYYKDSAFSAPQTYTGAAPKALDTPVVTIADNGIASWTANANASGYKYKINNGAETPTAETSVKLLDGQSISVMAVSKNAAFLDSEYSLPQTYTAPVVPDTPTKLDAPVVTVSLRGVASWSAVTGADSYKYKINDGAEVLTRNLSVQLTNIGDTIVVKAIGDDVYYSDSEFSVLQTYEIPENCPHVDDNNDTICDVCEKSVLAQLSFLSINDLHGKFLDTGTQPGLDEMTTYLKNLYADETREEILLSTGDMFQGTAESSLTKGKLMTTWMNAVNFEAMALGNHEFDWGVNAISDVSDIANFPILGINVTVNGSRPNYIKPSVTVERAGVKIGIIGAIGNCLSSISGDYATGLYFYTGDALTNLVKNESNRLRSEEGCDVVVYILHDGHDSSYNNQQDFLASEFSDGKGNIYYDVELSNGYVDLVFESHTHQNYILRDQYGVYHLQGASENRNINLADMTFNTVTKEIVTVAPNKIPVSTYAASNIAGDPVVQEIYNQFQSYFPEYGLYTSIGTNSQTRNSSAIADKVAQLYYEFGQETWGDKYNIVLGGGFLKPRNPYNIYSGQVTYADIFAVLPFDNEIVLGSISGYYLKSKFINSTNSDYHCYYTVDASSINDNSTYYIIVDSYTSTYTSNRITEVKRLGPTKYARDLLADYVRTGAWGYSNVQSISIAEALRIGNALSDNGQTSDSYQLTGRITRIANSTYWNVYITDGSDTIYIYGVTGVTGTLKVGDTITVIGPIKKYVTSSGTTIEVMNSSLVSHTAS